MSIDPTVAVRRAVDRPARDVAHWPRQNVYDDVAFEAAEAPGVWPERAIEISFWPLTGPEYTGRA